MIAFARKPISVPALTASRSMSPVEILGMPLAFASRSACVPLPAPGGPSITRFSDIVSKVVPPLRPSPANPRFLHEAIVVPHDQLALDLLHGIHGHANHNQQRGAAEVEQHAHT